MALALVAVVSAVALGMLARNPVWGILLGLVSIACVSYLYAGTWTAPSARDAGGAAPPAAGRDVLVTAVDETLEGGRPDVSTLDPEVAAALERVADKLDYLAREIAELSPSDELTSLAKEEVFNNVLWREFNRALRYKAPVSVALIDIDDYERLRSQRGPAAADELVRRVASVILQVVRETDLAARYGEERFAVIMPETGRQGALDFRQRLARAVEEGLAKSNGGSAEITVSIGVASLPAEDIRTAPELVESAAAALERARQSRGGISSE